MFDLGSVESRFQFRISNLRVENLDSFGPPLSLLDPVDGEESVLSNSVTIKAPVSRPLRVVAEVLLGISSQGKFDRLGHSSTGYLRLFTLKTNLLAFTDGEIEERVDVGVDIKSGNFVTSFILQVLLDRFAQFPLQDILDIDCWLATLATPELDRYGVRVDKSPVSFAVRDLSLNVSDVSLTLDCHECGPALKDMAATATDSSSSEEDTVRAARTLTSFVESVITGDSMQRIIDQRLAEAPKRCRHRPEYQPGATKTVYDLIPVEKTTSDTTKALVSVLCTSVAVVAAAVAVAGLIRILVSRRQRQRLKSLKDEQLHMIVAEQGRKRVEETRANELTSSMFRSEFVPRFARWFIPLVLVANAGLFLSGHLSPGATVKAIIQIGGEEIRIEELYSVSILESMIELWKSGAKVIAVRCGYSNFSMRNTMPVS
jgi:hypothetical protein